MTRPEDDGVAETWTIVFEPVRVGSGDLVMVYRQQSQPDVQPVVEGVASSFRVTVVVPPDGDAGSLPV